MPPQQLNLAANANGTTGGSEPELVMEEQAAEPACAICHKVEVAVGPVLLYGIDCHKDHALGLVNVTEAAHLGSDVGQLLLGKAFAKGLYGLSKDPVRARFWLEKTDWEEAKELLQELGQ